ncbi:hypothetical protein PHLCEN_2v3656 [Hermanssonia centrifuga]|uniref:Major facilitator superfamily (MFS) profile domain-containing protein n=1 Tax=Hermanssonia centrifuga TaxID=98765 RepID=A0A2R6QEM4_9APHY|nr:hypothetical protein PHLCEN_2v3656 [Hermanssonia centrifuga]
MANSPSSTLPHLPEGQHPKHKKGSAFWLSYLSIVFAIFLSALDLTAVSTVLPTVTADLNGGDEFTWVGSAYALASTAILPLSGALADIFGRKPILMGAIVFFSLGSALAGAAQTMNMLIGARTVQGIGGGAISFLALTISADLVPLNERGLYQGMVSLTWALASGVGPPIGGALAEKASWRWLFYLNLPVTGVAFGLVWMFLKVRTPHGSIKAKLARVDWLGNLIIIAGTTLAIVGLTFGGIRFPWVSAQVLAPLIIGVLTIIGFIMYERYIPGEPAVPWAVISNRTSLAGYMTTMAHGIIMISLIYYLPVYFQATLGSSPLGSAVKGLPSCLIIAPFALMSGLSIHFIKRYRPTITLGWMLLIAGFGILSLLKAGDSTAKWVGFQIVAAAGTGMLFSSPIFAVLVDLPVERTASATATFVFTRTFAQTWGITIASTVLQNELKKKLPAAFVSQFPDGVEIAYAAIPYIKSLPEPLRTEVREAFADSLSVVWKVMVGVGGLGLLSVLIMKEIPMGAVVDAKYGLDESNTATVPDEEGSGMDRVSKQTVAVRDSTLTVMDVDDTTRRNTGVEGDAEEKLAEKGDEPGVPPLSSNPLV